MSLQPAHPNRNTCSQKQGLERQTLCEPAEQLKTSTVPPKAPTMDEFVKGLKTRGIIDVHQVGLPGCQIVLPYGRRLVDRYVKVTTDVMRHYGFAQYDYPQTASTSVFAPARKVLELENRLLLFGTEAGLAKGAIQGGICPTGEATIYNHWRSLVRRESDLPLLMYQRTRYTRPVPKSSQTAESIFKPVENADVFEFHAAVESEHRSKEFFEHLKYMNRELADHFYLPVLESRRPLWTNRYEVSNLTQAGDVILPTGKTLQVTCLYLQGDLFSKPFGISFKKKEGGVSHTHHVTGAVSRRLLLAHLFLGMNKNRELLVHPDLAPTQLQLMYAGASDDELQELSRVATSLASEGTRIDIAPIKDRSRVSSTFRESIASGTPLTLLIQGKRHNQDSWKIIACRSDGSAEEVLYSTDIESTIVNVIKPALRSVSAEFLSRVQEVALSRIKEAKGLTEAQDLLMQGFIVKAPLLETHAIVDQVASWQKGEVLGFNDEAIPRRCIVSECMTSTSAYIAARI